MIIIIIIIIARKPFSHRVIFFRALRVLEILIHLTSSCTALYGEPEHQAQSPAVAGVFLRPRWMGGSRAQRHSRRWRKTELTRTRDNDFCNSDFSEMLRWSPKTAFYWDTLVISLYWIGFLIGDFQVAFRLSLKLVLFTCKWTKLCVWIKLIPIS